MKNKIYKFIVGDFKNIYLLFFLLSLIIFRFFGLSIFDLTDIFIGITITIFLTFFLKDAINTIIIKLKLNPIQNNKINTGVAIIIGDWGAGKTFYFNNEYVKKYKGFQVERLSCFSYTRDEFIKQLVSISFWNRWLSLNGLFSGYIIFNWHNMLPKNKLILIDDLERLPCDDNMANDFIGIINILKNDNHIVLVCSEKYLKPSINKYIEKIVDFTPKEITIDTQIELNSIIKVVESTRMALDSRNEALRNSIDSLVETLSENKESQYSFINLFSGNHGSYSINLRNVKKVLTTIYEAENSESIIEVIRYIVAGDKSRNITIDKIKLEIISLKTKNLIEQYLLAYQLLFTYPDLKSIIKDYKISLGDNKTEEFNFKNYLINNIEPKYIENFISLYLSLGLDILSNLSFDSVGLILGDISRLNKFTRKELLLPILLYSNDSFTKVEQKFTDHSNFKRSYSFIKNIALYEYMRSSFPNESIESYIDIVSSPDSIISLPLVSDSFLYFEYLKTFWKTIMASLIEEYQGIPNLIDEVLTIINQEKNNVVIGVRFLTLLKWYCIKNNHKPLINQTEFLNGSYEKNKKVMKRILDSDGIHTIKSAYYLFDLFVEYDEEFKNKIVNNIKKCQELLNSDERFKSIEIRNELEALMEDIKKDFKSLFISIREESFKL